MLVLPRGEPVRAAPMNDGRCGTWTGELDILREDVDTLLFEDRPLLNQALPECNGVWILTLCGRAHRKYRC